MSKNNNKETNQCTLHSFSGSTLTTVTKRKLKPYEFVCDGCGKLETMSAYCIAQITMGHAIVYTCDVCGHKTDLEDF
jgi:transcription elongation factor Elf1